MSPAFLQKTVGSGEQHPPGGPFFVEEDCSSTYHSVDRYSKSKYVIASSYCMQAKRRRPASEPVIYRTD